MLATIETALKKSTIPTTRVMIGNTFEDRVREVLNVM